MTAINFPANPSNGDTHQGFVYNSTLGVWQSAGSQTAVTSFTGLSDTPSTLGTAGQIAKVNSGATALEFADQSGVTVYANVDALPGSGNTGDLAFVTATNRLYLWNGSGWYNIALINTTPSISGVNSSYALASDGTATVITITAVDAEGLPITYSIASDTSGNIATVTQGTGASSNVFTITPSTNDANGGTFSLTFRASDGVNIASSIASFTLQFSIENSNYTTALITSVGANNAVNNTFVDSSTNNQTITVAGNVTQTTFSPYRHGGYSTYFDGSGDYLEVTSTVSPIGTDDFTIEGWYYLDSAGSGNVRHVWDFRPLNNDGSYPTLRVTSSNEYQYLAGGANRITSSAVTLDAWHHVAIVRNSSTTTLYIDGSSAGTWADTTPYDLGGNRPLIGGSGYHGSTLGFHGYITDWRFVDNTAVYTSAFTPPTERLTAITNTSLLTCHLPYIADGSTNGHAITVNGNTKTEPFAPYDSSAAYSASTNGGSLYNDGTGTNYLSVTSNDFQFGTSDDFVIEAWVYPAAAPSGAAQVFDNRGAANGLNLAFTGAFANYSEPLASQLTGTTKSLNQWYHVAVVRYNGTRRLFVNGVSEDSVADTGNYNSNSGIIASRWSTDSQAWNGNISDFRIIRGTIPAAYQGTSITVPTAPLAADSYTKLHLKSTNAGIIDKSQSVQTLTLSSTVKSSTTQTKYLSSSMYFNGTSDYITLSKSDLISNWNSENFTVEAWVYPTASSGYNVLFSDWGPAPRTFATGILNGNWYFTWTPNGGSTSTLTGSAVTLNQWYHFAVTKSGTTVKIYINGTLDATQTGVSLDNSSTNGTVIGSKGNLGDYFDGYVSDLRFSRGLVRYTANFTPPTAELKG